MSWPTKKLGEVTERLRLEKSPLDSWPYIEIGDIDLESKSIIFKDKKSIKGAVIAPKDSVLVSRVRPTRGAIVLTDKNYPISSAFTILKAKQAEASSKFLFYWLGNSKTLFVYLGKKQKGSNYPSVREKDILNFQIPLPPLAIQKQIVERLDKIAEAQKLNDDLIQKSDELYRSLLHGELNQKSEFKTQKLGEISEVTSSKRIYQSEYVKDGIPFYRTKEIVELSQNNPISLELFISGNRFNEIKEKFGVPKKGDILISAVGTIGISWVVPDDRKFYFKDGNLLWIKNLQGVDPIYLKIALENFSKNISKMGAGAAYNALTIIKLKKVQIPVTPIETQKKIVAKLSAVQDYKTQLFAQKSKFKELFDSTLDRSMKN